MAKEPEEKKVDEEIIEEPVETPVETPAEEPKEKPKEEPVEEPEEPKLESKTSFLKRLKKSMQIKKAPAEEPTEEPEEPEPKEPKGEEDEYEEINPNFVEAAQKANWTDAQIVEFVDKNDYSNDDLDELIGDVLAGVAEKPSEKPPEEKPPEKEPEEKKTPDAKLDDLLKEGKLSPEIQSVLSEISTNFKTMGQDLATLKEGVGKTKADEAINEYVGMEDLANKMFDKTAEEFEEFGKTAELPRFPDGRIVPIGPSFDARSKVWDMAVKLWKTGTAFDVAMEDALQWHKGSSAEKRVRAKVVKDLKKNESKLTPKRSEKNVQKQYAEGEEDERKADVVKAAFAKTGVKGY